MKRLLLVRPFANVMNLKNYNSQEIGLCKAFCKQGYDCDIIYFSTEDRSEVVYRNGNNRVTIMWRKGIKFGTMAVYLKYLNPVSLAKYDIIISNEYCQVMSILLTLLHRNVYIYHGPYHNTFETGRQMRFYDVICVPLCNRFAKGVFTKTNDAAEFLSKKGIKKITTVGVGLDIDKFKNTTGQAELSDNSNTKKKNNILYVGTDDQNKRVGYIVKVFAALCNGREDVQLTIVGDISRSRRAQLFRLVNSQYRDRIIFLGKVDNAALADIYGNAVCSVLASEKEIFGMVVLESMFFQLPCVASSTAGPKTVIDDHINGILEDNYDIIRWKDDIEYLLDNPKLRENMGMNARKKVLRYFTWDKVVHKMMSKIRL